MGRNSLGLYSRRDLVRATALAAVLVAAALWVSFQFLQPAPPRRIVLASGVAGGLYHQYAQRYRAILARDGVTVEERMTSGAGDNLRLLLDPGSGVDVAFMQGGVATFPAADDLVMLASLYYEPLWVFYRGAETFSQINELRGKRLAIGIPGSGTRAFVEPLLALNGIAPDNTPMQPLGAGDALQALRAGQVDAAIMVGGAQTDTIQNALRDPSLKLLSFERADAYQRRFPYISKLTLPPGTIDFAHDVPPHEVTLIGTKAMLAARDSLHPALVNLLTDATREIHGTQGYFEAAGEFPGTAHVDLRVSPEADRHRRFGPSLLHRYLPFWVATFVERAIILVVPLLVVLVPLFNFLPQFLRWRVRSRIYRWYGELALLERDVATRSGELPIEKWLQDLDRIERAAEQIHTPMSFASEAYTLREHIGLVRRSVLARANNAGAKAA
jgi:TRAP transporter TAXI family solute receptor